MDIILIAGCSQNGIIGADNEIPWREPEDLKNFKEETKGHVVLMGRKTWESLPRKPLPDRYNLVLTNQYGYQKVGAQTVHSPLEAIEICNSKKIEKMFIIGGAEVYKAFKPYATKLILSVIDYNVMGDTFWPWYWYSDIEGPEYLPSDFKLVSSKVFTNFDVFYCEKK